MGVFQSTASLPRGTHYTDFCHHQLILLFLISKKMESYSMLSFVPGFFFSLSIVSVSVAWYESAVHSLLLPNTNHLWICQNLCSQSPVDVYIHAPPLLFLVFSYYKTSLSFATLMDSFLLGIYLGIALLCCYFFGNK